MKRNPNGYGCVTRLSGNRSRPWIVKVTVYDRQGQARQTPVGYAATRQEAMILLAQYNHNPWEPHREQVTLAELYRRWAEVKLPQLGRATQLSLRSAYKHCAKYYGVKYRALRSFQMQDAIDNCGCSYSMQWMIKNLWGHLDRFAFECDIIEKMYSQLTTAATIPDTTRSPFTQGQIDALWAHREAPWVDTVLIFLYTGFRLTELLTMKTSQVDLQEMTLTGGLKTASGKGRVVPIHSRIQGLVRRWVGMDQEYLLTEGGRRLTPGRYYRFWGEAMGVIGAEKTPHEARHTLETMLDNAGGNRKCIDLIMGHKSKDVGNRVYNHKTLEQLRQTIQLMK